MGQNGRRVFLGKVIFEGRIILKTGLHIGGSKEAMQIGGLDLPVIKDSQNGLPYIPGSSLKGKMRSTLEKFGTRTIQKAPEKLTCNRNIGTGRNPLWIHCCDDVQHALNCEVCRIFGSSGDDRALGRGKRAENFPSPLMVRDALLDESFIQPTRTLTEVKTETGVDRQNMSANPRQVERVLPGAIFAFDLVYSVEELETGNNPLPFPEARVKKDLENILTCLEIIQQEALGGYSSRGYGKVQFTFTKFLARTLDYYKGVGGNDNENEKGKLAPDGFTVSEARQEIKNLVDFLKKEKGHALPG